MESGEPFDLDRFVDAQDGVFDTALAELRAGRKQSHWMWFIFPQIAGLGRSPMAQRYAIRSLDEARAYAGHPILGPRLLDCVQALLAWGGTFDAQTILGPVDAMKLRSSLTLFEAATGDARFRQARQTFFPDGPDEATMRLLGR